MTRVSFNRVAESYDETRGFPTRVMDELVGKVVNQLYLCKTILDLGVGTGRFAKPLQHHGFDVVGVDIARKMISKAVEREVDKLVMGDACYLPFRKGSFDAVICIHILHLIQEWAAALRQICRVTRNLMVSIMYGGSDPIHEAYGCLLKKYGYEAQRIGKGEWELKDSVKPIKQISVMSYSRRADIRLDHLSRQSYSSQWEIPKAINQKIVAELKRRFAGETLEKELHLLVWDIDSIRHFVSQKKLKGR